MLCMRIPHFIWAGVYLKFIGADLYTNELIIEQHSVKDLLCARQNSEHDWMISGDPAFPELTEF